jgi:hypothetical protein
LAEFVLAHGSGEPEPGTPGVTVSPGAPLAATGSAVPVYGVSAALLLVAAGVWLVATFKERTS